MWTTPLRGPRFRVFREKCACPLADVCTAGGNANLGPLDPNPDRMVRGQNLNKKVTFLEFDAGQYVIETRSDQLAFVNVVRCMPRRMSDFYESTGKQVLLHAPRDLENKGYFGEALIDGYEPDPRGQGMFVFLAQVKLYRQPVSTTVNGVAREAAPLDAAGGAAFQFYANGIRPISTERFQNIVDATGSEYATRKGFAETAELEDPLDSPASAFEERIISRYRLEQRRVRARHRAQLIQRMGAFCCMGGASFNVPDGLRLLQVSHYWPLGHDGPDQLTNVGLMTANIHPIYENGLVTIRQKQILSITERKSSSAG